MAAAPSELPSPAPGPAAAPVQPASTSEIVHASSLSTCVLVVLVLSWSLGGHTLAQRSHYLTEGSAACALGLITGLILLVFHQFLSWDIVTQLLEFNAAGFFTYLLPPVIFHCGLSVEKSRFFMALPSILTFGVFGTLASFAIISIFLYGALGFALFKLEDCLAMGAIFAATDSVATLQVLNKDSMPGLFSLVFGEGVINDAVSVVLLGAVASTARGGAAADGEDAHRGGFAGGSFVFNFMYLLLTSLVLGAASGLGIAAALKRLALDDAHQELAVITLLSYLSYLLADVTGLSGILSLFVCGVLVSHYALHNVSEEGRQATMTGFRTASYLAEGIIFIYVGMDCLDPLKWQAANSAEAMWLVLVLMAVLVAARAAFVVPFSLLHNMWSADKLNSREIVVIWWAGLMRGAVSVALVYLYFDDNPRQMPDKGRATLIVSTLVIVMFSILGFGALTKPLLAAMLGGDTTLMEHIRTIPLLSNIATGSSAAAFIEQLDSSFNPHNPRVGGQQQQQRYSLLPTTGRAPDKRSPPGTVADSGHRGAHQLYSVRSDDERGRSGLEQAGDSQWNHTDNAAGARAAASAGGVGLGASDSNRSSQGEGLPAAAIEIEGGFSGFDVDTAANVAAQEDYNQAGEPLITGVDFGVSAQLTTSSTVQQGPLVAHDAAAGVELQALVANAGAAASSSNVMQQVGQAWGAFDKQFMQPFFRGPQGTNNRASPRGATGSSSLL